MSLFDQNSPADTVHTLVEYLRSEHHERDLYRGQVQDYPAMIPSMFRSGIEASTVHEKTIAIAQDRIYKAITSKTAKARHQFHSDLISRCGIAVGNILAQQYGVRSEAIDLTHDLRVAAFFATRDYPTYSHHLEPGIGVIYRFRSLPNRLQARHKNHITISGWFQMGEWDGKYFDVFVHQSDYEAESLDRDKWLGRIPRLRAIVSTLPLRMTCDEVHEMILGLKHERLAGLWNEIPQYDHRLTRTFNQSGGFIRPRFFWEADIPSQYRLMHVSEQWWGPSPFQGMAEFNELAPRVLPSTAIKVKLVGIENVRRREDCEAFFFRHHERPVTGIYRRKLWPEPSEDPVYSLLWQHAIVTHFFLYEGTGDNVPAVDDPDRGLLDRGYRVAGEKQTMDAREIDDLMRGQLEDATEAVSGPERTAKDWIRLSAGLYAAGEKRRAVVAAINAVKCDAYDVEAGVALAGALWQAGRVSWSHRVLLKVEKIDASHPELLYNLAMVEINGGNHRSAFNRLVKALKRFDRSQHDLPSYSIFEALLYVSELLGEVRTAEFARSALEGYSRRGEAFSVVEGP